MCIHCACSSAPKSETVPARVEKPVAKDLEKASELFRQRDDPEKLREARELVAHLREADHRNFDIEWLYAKYSLFLGQKTADEIEREKILEEGRDAGKIASRIEANRPEGYFWYGANLAELARLSPVTVGYTSVDDIREAMNKVIAIDPSYEGASAYDVLAEIELNTRLFGGKASKAVELLEKAIQIEKNNSNLYLHLAQAYLDVDETDKAKAMLQHILKMQPHPDYAPEHRSNMAEARKLLASRY